MLYAGTIIITSGIYPSAAIILSWLTNNVSGQTKRVTAHALQTCIRNLGVVIETQLYRPKQERR